MTTIAPPPPQTKRRKEKGRGGGFGQGGFGDGNGPEGGAEAILPDRRYHTGMMLVLAAIIMFFAAFTSAYVIRKGLSEDWLATGMPGILWLNTVALLTSSFTLEKARRSCAQFEHFVNWWLVTTLLGVFFLVGQLLAWRQLAASGVYMNTNPSSSFFYLLTGAHGLHLLGGVAALFYILSRVRSQRLEPVGHVAVRVTALYWHFMDGLWVYLFLLLLLWR